MAEDRKQRPLSRGEKDNLIVRSRLGHWSRKSALLVLHQFQGQKTHCWPNMTTISECMCCSIRQAREAVSDLRALGVVAYEDLKIGTDSREYEIDFDRLKVFYHDPFGGPVVEDEFIAEQLLIGRGRLLASSTPRHSVPEGNNAPKETDPGTVCRTPQHKPQHNVPDTPAQTPAQCAARTNRQDLKLSIGTTAVVESDVKEPVCVSDRREELTKQLGGLRRKQRAIELLREAGVWDKSIGDCVEAAEAASGDGNPIPRITEVLDAYDRARESKLRQQKQAPNAGKWITAALTQGWDVSNQRRKSA